MRVVCFVLVDNCCCVGVSVMCIGLAVPRVGMWYVIAAFPGDTHLPFV